MRVEVFRVKRDHAGAECVLAWSACQQSPLATTEINFHNYSACCANCWMVGIPVETISLLCATLAGLTFVSTKVSKNDSGEGEIFPLYPPETLGNRRG